MPPSRLNKRKNNLQNSTKINGVELLEVEARVLEQIEEQALRRKAIKIDKTSYEILKKLLEMANREIPVIDEIRENSLGVKIENFQIISLNLPNCGLTHLPSCFGKLKSLKYLNLEQNQLEKLPDSFVELTQLQELNLSHNKLKELPVELEKLSNLKKLIWKITA